MIVFDGFALIGIVVIIIALIISGIINAIKNFLAWRKTGYCKHKYELYSTCSFGQHAWHKCNKCGNEKLM
jgi:hypothetical protein